MYIPYKAAGFERYITSGHLSVTWPELVWAAVTYGKSSRLYHLTHPGHSRAEKKHRTYLLYTCLKQQGGHVQKSELYSEMDHTEKGSASYFLGMVLTKLAADKLLDTPYLWHVSTSSQAVSYAPGNSRPDLIGYNTNTGVWIVAEAKGRSARFDGKALASAKSQSQMINSINGITPRWRFGAESHFSPNLEVTLEDPPADDKAIALEFNLHEGIAEYYSIRNVLRSRGAEKSIRGIEYVTVLDEDLGVTVGLPRALLQQEDTDVVDVSSISVAHQQPPVDAALDYIGSDSFAIQLDDRWSQDQMSNEPHQRDG